ncbi:hypothetical protein [Lacrimispora brassicae]
MLNFKGTKQLSKSILAILLVMVFTFVMATAAFASEALDNANGNIISHSETWVTPYKHVEVTVYDLGDGFTSTEIITDEYGTGLQRASGTKTQKSTVEIKNGSAVAATITVSGTFSYDGSSAKVTDYSHSKSVKSGYTETSWSTNKGGSGLLSDAYVGASLTIKQTSTSKTYSGSAKVTCGKNG